MPRLESRALQLAEGHDAAGRATKSEDRLIVSIDRFAKYAFKRKARVVAEATGADQEKGRGIRPLTKKKREMLRDALKNLADAAT